MCVDPAHQMAAVPGELVLSFLDHCVDTVVIEGPRVCGHLASSLGPRPGDHVTTSLRVPFVPRRKVATDYLAHTLGAELAFEFPGLPIWHQRLAEPME